MIFGGPFKLEARKAYAHAVGEGFGGFGPAIYAELFSHGRDPWVFQESIAEALGCSVRTVQRHLRKFREAGWLECWRAKKREIPPGLKKRLPCGWSHRSLTAWHHIGAAFQAACERIAAKRAKRKLAIEASRSARNRAFVEIVRELQALGLTGAELDAELAAQLARRFPGPPE